MSSTSAGIVGRIVGFRQKPELKQEIDNILAKA
jgi:hypothetical protein